MVFTAPPSGINKFTFSERGFEPVIPCAKETQSNGEPLHYDCSTAPYRFFKRSCGEVQTSQLYYSLWGSCDLHNKLLISAC